MASRHTRFRFFYRVGFTPWEGHALGQGLRDLVEGTPDTAPLPTGSALDVGCGTGDSSIYLAQRGWHVTGVDYVAKPLAKARAKAGAAGVSVDFVHADVTQLSQSGIGTGFELIVDNGCLHNMSGDDREAYVREVSALAAPGARLLIVAFPPGGRFGVPGIDHAEMERRFAQNWTLLSTGEERELDEKTPTRYYLFERRPADR
ncbi:class I SAM-dependent methyltransferase [Mycobacterium sp. 94-17]|uniref:class I SAM-dependent methyltransferase n=1 Tax=Mycobacterium sp. 94-17 TaxID=2986147 RepID=UPI002D1F04AA|nr:class I SAM-dependent methyltransferase [Mycobacterium sp. 94-17]MEB4210057.1 class I SAM-dependent methyltransferase [Mycobacterium sp. 94-17]